MLFRSGITEGSTNKYYTDTRVRNALAVSGSGLSYNNTNGTFSVNSTALATPNTIVFRDVSGNFAANVITATLQGNASTATKVATARTIGITGDATWSTTFDGSANVTAGLTLATVNSAPGSFGATNKTLSATVDAKGRITALSQADIVINSAQVSDWATAVRTTAGGMFTDNAEYGVAATYNGTTGKVEFNVADYDLSFTGDATGTGTVIDLTNTSIALTLADTGITAGQVGGANAIPVLTLDSKGRVVGVNTTVPNINSSSVSNFVEAAQDATASLITAATHSGVSVVYDDDNNKLAFTNTDKGSTQEIFKNIVVNGSSKIGRAHV